MDSPVAQARRKLGLTQEGLGLETQTHPQAVFLCEQGVYTTILPALARFFETEGFDIIEMEREYERYQRDKRRNAGNTLALAVYELDAPELGVAPFFQFRKSLGMSRMRFAKSFCVHPASLYSLERGSAGSLPEQLRIALDQAGLSSATIAEIEERCKEFHRGEWQAQPV